MDGFQAPGAWRSPEAESLVWCGVKPRVPQGFPATAHGCRLAPTNQHTGRETMLKHAAACLALLATSAMPASAAPFMIVGNDEKPGTDADGKPAVNPAGNDTVVIFDLAKPEEPTVVATLKLENSIVGPPTNL